MHAHLPLAVPQLTDGQRIVEVLRIGRVDGKRRNATEVYASGDLIGWYLVRDLVSRLFHHLRVAVRQTELHQDSVHLRIVITCGAQYLNDLTHRVTVSLRPLRDPHNRLVASLSTLQAILRDEDIIHQQTVVDLQEGIILRDLQLTHEGVMSTLQDVQHLPLLDASLAARKEADTDRIAHDGLVQVLIHDENLLATILRHEEYLSTRAALQLTHDGTATIVKPILPARRGEEELLQHQVLHQLDQLALLGHVRDANLESDLLVIIRLCRILLEETDRTVQHLLLRELLAPCRFLGPLIFFRRQTSPRFLI